MPEYKYYQDEDDMVWQRHAFTVTAQSEAEADAIIRENGLNRGGCRHALGQYCHLGQKI